MRSQMDLRRPSNVWDDVFWWMLFYFFWRKAKIAFLTLVIYLAMC